MVAVLLAISIALDASGSFHASGFDVTRISPPRASELFIIQVDAADGPPLLGSYSIRGSELIFTPRYALQPGLTYRATLKLPREEAISRRFTTPDADKTPTTFIEHVYPSASTLPENQLKFYIQFSAPMSRGDAYRCIHLLDDAGNPIPLAFLQLTEELWDREARRFTLFFDPGRIKTGVLPNVRLGLPIREGGRYTLVIDGEWHDSAGKPLKEAYRKVFNVGPAERSALDLSA